MQMINDNSKMLISSEGINFIARHEGLRLEKYLDQAGQSTIGYGHLILPGETYDTITSDAAQTLLAQDSEEAQTAVRVLVHQPQSQHQFDALVDFTFNLGAHALARSGLRRHINAGMPILESYWTAWDFAGSHPLSGLKRRREDEFQLYSTGEYS